MARQVGTQITGTFGNLIYYKFRGGYYIRAKPTVVKQTKGTKAAAGMYGKAAAFAKQLRIYLEPLIPDPKSKVLRNRLTPAVYRMQREADLSRLNGFELHDQKGLGTGLTLKPLIRYEHDGILGFTLPTFTPKDRLPGTPATSQVRLSVMAAFLSEDLTNNTTTKVLDIEIPYGDTPMAEQMFTLANEVPQPCMVIVALRMQFVQKGTSKSRKSDLAWIAGCLSTPATQ